MSLKRLHKRPHSVGGPNLHPRKKKKSPAQNDISFSSDDDILSDIDFSALEDGMSEEEFWARKLGLVGDSKDRNMERLAEEYAKDGLGDDFLELFDFMDNISASSGTPDPSSAENPPLSDKYIPPHRRTSITGVDGSVTMGKKRCVSLVGLLNRVSEGNLDSISREIISIVVEQRLAGAGLVARAVVAMACDNPHITVTLQGTFAGIICAVAIDTAPSNQYSGGLLAEIVTRVRSDILDASKWKTITNLVRLLACLFSLGLYSVDVIDSLLRFLAEVPDVSPEKRMEWILTCIRFTGRVLRDHHKSRFSMILDRVTDNLAVYKDEGKQVEFALKELSSMREGKSNFRAVDHLQTVAEWLIIRNSTSNKFKSSEGSTLSGWKIPKEVEAVQLVVPHVSKLFSEGYTFPEEWVRGSIGGEDDVELEALGPASNDTAVNKHSPSLEELASMNRMTTEVKKNAFIAIMGSLDSSHALIRLDQFGLLDKPKNCSSIVSVIVHCAIQEPKVNQFYLDLMRALCNSQRDPKRDRKFSISFKIEFSKLITSGKLSPGEISVLSNLIAFYIQLSNGTVTMQDILGNPQVDSQ